MRRMVSRPVKPMIKGVRPSGHRIPERWKGLGGQPARQPSGAPRKSRNGRTTDAVIRQRSESVRLTLNSGQRSGPDQAVPQS
ncbi:hypothetical protein M444_28105 [Streptomyces sp. Mg1]|nr:hypothetical protein M444_28105 [Streptomyces sp. Mg1]